MGTSEEVANNSIQIIPCNKDFERELIDCEEYNINQNKLKKLYNITLAVILFSSLLIIILLYTFKPIEWVLYLTITMFIALITTLAIEVLKKEINYVNPSNEHKFCNILNKEKDNILNVENEFCKTLTITYENSEHIIKTYSLDIHSYEEMYKTNIEEPLEAIIDLEHKIIYRPYSG